MDHYKKVVYKINYSVIMKTLQASYFYQFLMNNNPLHGQTSANRIKPGPSFQL